MGALIELDAFRKKQNKVIIRSEEEIFEELKHLLIIRWNYENKNNNINGFISSKLQTDPLDYVSDLNAVAALEQDCNLTVCVKAPCFTDNTDWVASFAIGEDVHSSVEADSETKARLFCVLLYHTLMDAASITIKQDGANLRRT